jgi:hypothetical protein
MIPNHALASLIHAQTIQANRPQNAVLESRLHVGFFYCKTEKELLRGMFVVKIEQRDAETPLGSEMIHFRRKLQGHAARRL